MSGSGRYGAIVVAPRFFARLDGDGSPLGVEPAPASWDRAGSLGQARSTVFIEGVFRAVEGALGVIEGPRALMLDVGLPHSVDLYGLNDLDNYLFPLVPRLTRRTGLTFTTVWATKAHRPTSTAAVGRAVPTADPGGTMRSTS